MKKILTAMATLATALAVCGPAAAHITLASTATPAGSTFKAVLVVGHGCTGAATTQLRVQIPEGFYNVKPMPKAGWELKTVTGPYAAPFEHDGTTLNQGVTEISWSGGELPDAYFDEFTFFGTDLAEGTQLYFPVIQVCGDKEDAWIDTSGDENAEMPAPAVTLTPAEPAEHHH